MNLKFVATFALAALALGGLVVGPGRAFVAVRAARERVKGAVESGKPDDQVVAEAKVVYHDLEAAVAQRAGEIAQFAGGREDLQAKIASMVRAQGETRKKLGVGAELLKGSETTFVIGGRTIDRATLEADAKANLIALKQFETQLERLQKQETAMREAESRANAELDRAKSDLTSAAVTLEALEAELQSMRLEEQIRADTAQLLEANRPLAQPGELAGRIAELKKRLTSRRASLDQASNSIGQGRIDWSSASDRSQALLDEMNQALNKDGANPSSNDSPSVPTSPSN